MALKAAVMAMLLFTALTSGCASGRSPAPPPPAASTAPAPTPTSTTTCFLLQVYDPATRQYEKKKICSTASTPQSTPKRD